MHDPPLGFVNVPAEEMCGLDLLDEIAHRSAAGVQTFMHTVERGIEWGAWQIITRFLKPSNFARRSAISFSLYSPGVSNGVGLE